MVSTWLLVAMGLAKFSPLILLVLLDTMLGEALKTRLPQVHFGAHKFVRNIHDTCSESFNSSEGILQSPGYPNHYSNDLNCFWSITAEEGTRISIEFIDLEIEYHRLCIYDALMIRDGGNISSPLMGGKICGGYDTNNPLGFTTSGNQVFIQFRTDHINYKKGFKLKWTPYNIKECQNHPVCPPGLQKYCPACPVCSNPTECPKSDNIKNYGDACGGIFNSSTGILQSPGYPVIYTNNLDCFWYINTQKGTYITIEFTDLNVEFQRLCVYDSISIRDGDTLLSPLIGGKICGGIDPSHPYRFSTTANHALVHFKTDYLNSKKGFELKWTTAYIEDEQKNIETSTSDPAILSVDEFISKFNKTYENEAETTKRIAIFQDNVEVMKDHNKLYEKGESSYQMGVNEYSDLTYDEVIDSLTGIDGNVIRSNENDGLRDWQSDHDRYIPKDIGSEPESMDYRDKGAINPIRNQGRCGSCWAFAAVSSIESHIFLQNGQLVQLSEQYLVDCTIFGCGGGWTDDTILYVRNNGIANSDGYPYTATEGTCNQGAPNTSHKVTGIQHVNPGRDAELLNALVHMGPISVYVYISPNFGSYRGGVLEDNFCTPNKWINHAVVLVGYGNENGKDYWLIRNSWGESWGEEGYIKLARNVDNHCRISDFGYITQIKAKTSSVAPVDDSKEVLPEGGGGDGPKESGIVSLVEPPIDKPFTSKQDLKYCCDASQDLYNTSVCADVVCNQPLTGSIYQICRSDNTSIGDFFTTDQCQGCVCVPGWRGIPYPVCHTSICPGSPYYSPHYACETLYQDTGELGCCKEYFCENTTCITDFGSYLAIGEEKVDPEDPCTTCQCSPGDTKTSPPYSICATADCAMPPAPNCRPIKFSTDCCARDWDCTNSYLIVTPKRWAAGGVADVCLFTPSGDNVLLDVELKVKSYNIAQTLILSDDDMYCANLSIPQSVPSGTYSLSLVGQIGNVTIRETRDIQVASIAKTWIQTDKFLYLPGQLVQFRILTVRGLHFQVLYEEIPEVFIHSISGSRIAQWLNIDNSHGIVHLNFTLADEPEEGLYQIIVATSSSLARQSFKVEPFVLPRFTVTITPPAYVLASDMEANFTICANYTFGEPVEGYLEYSARPSYNYGRPSIQISEETDNYKPSNFVGCQDVSITPKDIGNSLVTSFTVEATVEEKGTDISARAEVKIQVHRSMLNFKKISIEKYYKFGLPITLQVLVTNPEDRPAIDVCVLWNICSNFTTDSNGILSVVIPSNINETETQITVSITCDNCFNSSAPKGFYYPEQSSATYHFDRFYSPSWSFLSIVSNGNGDCGLERDIDVDIYYVAEEASETKLWIMLISTGRIISTTHHQVELVDIPLNVNRSQVIGGQLGILNNSLVRGSATASVLLPNGTSNLVKVLAWYARSDGEVVAASTSLEVPECPRNHMALSWTPGYPQEPGNSVNVTVRAQPNSFCSIGVVDRSVELLSRTQGGHLTLAALTSLLKELEPASWEIQTDDQYYCTGNEFGGGNGGFGIDFRKKREENERIKRSIFGGWSSYTEEKDAITAFDDFGVYVLSDLTLETRPCINSNTDYFVYDSDSGPDGAIAEEAGMGIAQVVFGPPPDAGLQVMTKGTALPTMEDGQVQQREYFPETWLWKVLLVPESGVWQQELELPDTITEWVGEGVCVHPEAGLGVSNMASIITFIPFFLDLTIPATIKQGEAVPLKISVFNYLSEIIPVQVELSGTGRFSILSPDNGTASLCIEPSTKEVTTMVIRPTDAGDVNLTVTAFVNPQLQDACGTNVTAARRDTVVREIKVKWEGVEKQITKSGYLCAGDNATWHFTIPDNIVNGSARGFISVAADLMGPTVDNLDHLVRMPYGCGEQNMLGFTPNIFVMKYLTSAGLNTPDITQRATTNMEAGYKRELQYQHGNGSYSAFGKSDPSGSTWLTAFVLKSFAQARPFITVNEKDLIASKDWLESLQKLDGCFELVGRVIHKDMKGGLGGSDSDHLGPLTSYVLISLLEANLNTSVDTVDMAISCITNASLTTFYTEALSAYALALSADENATSVIMSSYLLVISEDESASSSVSTSVLVEAMSYVLLAMLTMPDNYVAEIANLVQIITKHSNGEGGFVSTQDTVVALQALAKYSELFKPSDDSSLEVDVTRGEENWNFNIDDSNQLLVQIESMDVKDMSAYNVSVTATGKGCALVSSILRYNIPTFGEVDAFSANITANAIDDCLVGISVCASYILPDGESNMAIMELDLTTGFTPEIEYLDILLSMKLIKRYEVEEGLVTLYFDSLSANPTCIKFKAVREVTVADAKAATLTLYDYYDPKLTISQNFLMEVGEGCSD